MEITKPRLAAQFESDIKEQEALFCAFAGDALIAAQPNSATFYRLVRQACSHDELAQLEYLYTVQSTEIRGLMFLALVGQVLCRVAVNMAVEYGAEI